MAIPHPAATSFCRHCHPLSSHSHCCQPMLAFTAPIDAWLLCPSLIHCPLPASLSAAPIIDTFVASLRALRFLICAILFSIAPLPPSMVVIPPSTAFNPRRAPLVLWCGCLSSVLASCCITSHHASTSCLLATPPVILLLTLVVHPDWLLCCCLHLSLRHHLQSTWASNPFYLPPPPPASNFLSPAVDVD
jgi:hypothetical protein